MQEVFSRGAGMGIKIAKAVIWICLPVLMISGIMVVLGGFKLLQLEHYLELWVGGCFSSCAFISLAGAYVLYNDFLPSAAKGDITR